jgi:hypothetical protein
MTIPNFRWSEWLARSAAWQFGSCWRASHRAPSRSANAETASHAATDHF